MILISRVKNINNEGGQMATFSEKINLMQSLGKSISSFSRFAGVPQFDVSNHLYFSQKEHQELEALLDEYIYLICLWQRLYLFDNSALTYDEIKVHLQLKQKIINPLKHKVTNNTYIPFIIESVKRSASTLKVVFTGAHSTRKKFSHSFSFDTDITINPNTVDVISVDKYRNAFILKRILSVNCLMTKGLYPTYYSLELLQISKQVFWFSFSEVQSLLFLTSVRTGIVKPDPQIPSGCTLIHEIGGAFNG